MFSNRFYGKKFAEEIIFLCRARTLPSKGTVHEVIDKFIPSHNRPNHSNSNNERNWFFEIHYYISDVGANSYKIELYYELYGGKAHTFFVIVGLLVGAIVAIVTASPGVWNYIIGIVILGVFGGAIGSVLSRFVDPTYSVAKKEAEKVCNNIVIGLKEYEQSLIIT